MRNTSPEPLRTQMAPSPIARGKGLAPTGIVAMIFPAEGRMGVGAAVCGSVVLVGAPCVYVTVADDAVGETAHAARSTTDMESRQTQLQRTWVHIILL